MIGLLCFHLTFSDTCYTDGETSQGKKKRSSCIFLRTSRRGQQTPKANRSLSSTQSKIFYGSWKLQGESNGLIIDCRVRHISKKLSSNFINLTSNVKFCSRRNLYCGSGRIIIMLCYFNFITFLSVQLSQKKKQCELTITKPTLQNTRECLYFVFKFFFTVQRHSSAQIKRNTNLDKLTQNTVRTSA